MLEARREQLLYFCRQIQVEFQDLSILDMALTHSSFANEVKGSSRPQYNERIEFLGDSVLSIIVSSYMYSNYPNLAEGKLTKYRAHLVCEGSLAEFAHAIKLGDYLQLGRGEAMNGGRKRDSILADAFEAVLGAIYLDAGMECASNYLMRIIKATIDDVCRNGIPVNKGGFDYKTALQEYLQRDGDVELAYELLGCSGPEHDKIFQMEVLLAGKRIGVGLGHKKKEAEQQAAKNAIEELNIELKA